jgi:hypothetical protein
MSNPKRAHFSKAFTAETEKEATAAPVPEAERGEVKNVKLEIPAAPQRSRAQKVQIPVYVVPEARRQLKMLCAETGRTQEDLLREALNDFFKKHQKPTIA